MPSPACGTLAECCITTSPRACDHSRPSSPRVANLGVAHTVASSKESRCDDERVEVIKVKALMIKDALDGNTKSEADLRASQLPPLLGGCWGPEEEV